jgi:glycosyltransferase involved in cell wall biosynthesis
LEGAAAAKPLVGSDIPGIDSIINGTNGVLVPPEDADALAAILVNMKNNLGLRKLMGSSGRRFVEQYFDRKEIGQLLLDFYERIGIKSNLDGGIVVSKGDKAEVSSANSKHHSA